MTTTLQGKTIAFVATDGFEPSELLEPLQAIKEAGAECHVIAPKAGTIKAWKDKWRDEVTVDKTLEQVKAGDYDALVLAGGTLNCDQLRTDDKAIDFIKAMFEYKKPVSAICHAPQLLIEAGVVNGRKLTSYHSIKTDLINAGADWSDEECVCDQALVTSRNPSDLKAFIEKTIEEINEGAHKDRKVA